MLLTGSGERARLHEYPKADCSGTMKLQDNPENDDRQNALTPPRSRDTSTVEIFSTLLSVLGFCSHRSDPVSGRVYVAVLERIGLVRISHRPAGGNRSGWERIQKLPMLLP